jgi:hypothetical protein
MADVSRLCKKCHQPVSGIRCLPCRRQYETLRKRNKRLIPEYRTKDQAATLKSYYKHHAKRRAEQNARGPEYIRASVIKSLYGITPEEYEVLLKKQKGVCAICKRPERLKNRYRGICRLHIDHDHKTNKVRGLLCSTCNFALGGFNDNPTYLLNAINYLKG